MSDEDEDKDKELIIQMQAELKYLKSQSDHNPDREKWIKELTEILKSAQAYGYESDMALFKYSFLRTPIPEKKKNRTISETMEAEDYIELMTYYRLVVGDDSPMTEFFSQPFLNTLGQGLESEFEAMDREGLIQAALEYAFHTEFLERKNHVLLEKIRFLENKLSSIKAKRILLAKKKGAGRVKKFQSDTEFAMEIYHQLAAELNRAIEPGDFVEYLFRVREGRPVPLFIPKARLTAEEKEQMLVEQNVARDVKARQEWSEARLRKLFMKLSGLITTRKV